MFKAEPGNNATEITDFINTPWQMSHSVRVSTPSEDKSDINKLNTLALGYDLLSDIIFKQLETLLFV